MLDKVVLELVRPAPLSQIPSLYCSSVWFLRDKLLEVLFCIRVSILWIEEFQVVASSYLKLCPQVIRFFQIFEQSIAIQQLLCGFKEHVHVLGNARAELPCHAC